MTVHMQVVLADYAVTHDGKVMMAGAGWSQVGSGPFASALAFIVKVPWDMANQQIAIHAELVDEDGRPVLSIELRAEQATESDLVEALARTVLIADRLLDETAAWIWIGGRIPADDGSPRRNQPLLRAVPDLADRLEG